MSPQIQLRWHAAGGKWLLVALLLVLGTWHSARAATLTSHQAGTATIAAGTSATNVALTPVDLARAFLVFGLSGSDTNPAEIQVSGQLTPGEGQAGPRHRLVQLALRAGSA